MCSGYAVLIKPYDIRVTPHIESEDCKLLLKTNDLLGNKQTKCIVDRNPYSFVEVNDLARSTNVCLTLHHRAYCRLHPDSTLHVNFPLNILANTVIDRIDAYKLF